MLYILYIERIVCLNLWPILKSGHLLLLSSKRYILDISPYHIYVLQTFSLSLWFAF